MSTRHGWRRAWTAAVCFGWLVCAGAIATATAESPGDPPAGAGASAAEDIRDIRGPRLVQPAWRLPALLAGIALLVVALYAVLRWRRGDKPEPPLLPHELALKRLDAIRAQMPALGATAFAVAASDVIRHYLEARFDVTATRRTTEEFLGSLLQSPVSTLVEHRALLQEFLRRCDYAKFAGAAGELESVEGLYLNARTFISTTAPQAA
jgi:hypothetical protein